MPAGLVFIFVVVDLDKRVWRGAVKGLKRPERFCRRLVSQLQVWLDVVVIVSPEGQLPAGIVEAVENLLVQQIVAQAAIEWLDEGILLGLPRIELMPVHVVVVAPFQDRPAGKLCPVITDNACELAKDPDQRLQCPRNLCARDGCVGHEAQVLAAAIIFHCQNVEPARCPERVGQEVRRPSFTRSQRFWHRCPRATRTFAAPSSSDTELLVRVEAIQLLVVHDHPFVLQYHADLAVAKSATLGCDGVHLFAYLRVKAASVKPESWDSHWV